MIDFLVSPSKRFDSSLTSSETPKWSLRSSLTPYIGSLFCGVFSNYSKSKNMSGDKVCLKSIM